MMNHKQRQILLKLQHFNITRETTSDTEKILPHYLYNNNNDDNSDDNNDDNNNNINMNNNVKIIVKPLIQVISC